MIILITNRNLHVSIDNVPVVVAADKIGQHLGNNGIYCAHVVNSSADLATVFFRSSTVNPFFIARTPKHLTIIPQEGLRKTHLNGKKVKKETNLRVGDIISAGGVSFKFE